MSLQFYRREALTKDPKHSLTRARGAVRNETLWQSDLTYLRWKLFSRQFAVQAKLHGGRAWRVAHRAPGVPRVALRP